MPGYVFSIKKMVELLSIFASGYEKRDNRIEKLERMVYDCVSLSDVMRAGLSEKLYNEIVEKFDDESKSASE